MMLQPSERAHLRQFLVDRFNLNELKSLAFDLGTDYEKIPHEEIEVFSRELIVHFEKRNKLNSLVTKIIQQRPDEYLVRLKAKLSPSDTPFKKMQIIITRDLLDEMSVLLEEITTQLNCSQDEVVLISY